MPAASFATGICLISSPLWFVSRTTRKHTPARSTTELLASATTNNRALLFSFLFYYIFTLTLSSAFEFMPPWLSPWSDVFSVSRDPALLCYRSAKKGASTPYCGWVVAVSIVLCSCVTDTYISPVRHPCPRFLPAFGRVSWIRCLIVSQVCMLLIMASALLTKRLESRFCHTSACCDEWKDRSHDIFSVNSFTSTVRVLICLVSVRRPLPCFTRGGKLSFLAQVLSTVASPSRFLRLHKALVLGPVTGRSSRAFLCTRDSEVLH